MDFTQRFTTTKGMLAEGAITERLRRRNDLSLHPTLFNSPLIFTEHGRDCLAEIYGEYRQIARLAGLPILLCAPTWRLDRQRIEAAGFTPELNREAVAFMQSLGPAWQDGGSAVAIGGLVGPKNDCYSPERALAADQSAAFHRWQVAELSASGVDCVVAQTFPAVSEALGVAMACKEVGIPSLISFVINRQGRLLDNTRLVEAVAQVDAATGSAPLGYMVNCVFPSFIGAEKQPEELFARLVGIQANASSLDHDQLEEAAELQQDDLRSWGEHMLTLHRQYGLKLLGGCCGTDGRYIRYLAEGLGGLAG